METRDYPRAADKVQGAQEEARVSSAAGATARLDSALALAPAPGPGPAGTTDPGLMSAMSFSRPRKRVPKDPLGGGGERGIRTLDGVSPIRP